LLKAEEAGLDLIEVSPNDNPPVCKIEDYGKLVYKQKKLEKKNKNKQKTNEIKGLRLSIAISDHDFDVKVAQAERFLKTAHPVKVALILKGREVAYRDMAIEKLQVFAEKLKELSQVEQMPKSQGYNVFMILNPRKN